MTSIADAYVELHVDGDNVESGVRTSIKKATPGSEKESDKSGLLVGAAWAKGFVKGLTPDVQKGFASTKGGIKDMSEGLKGLKIPALAAALPLATSGISALAGATTALVGSLVQAGGASLSMVGIMGALGQAKGTATLAVKGFSDAVAGDEEALKSLAPAAREVAEAATDLGDRWKGVQQSVQGAMFKGLADDLNGVANSVLPTLRTGLTETGSILNGVIQEVSRFAQSEGFVRKFGKAIEGNNVILRNLGTAAVPVLSGLLNVFRALQPSAKNLSGSIGDVAKRFEAWSSKGSTVKMIGDFMDRASESAKELWRLVKNLGATLINVFGAATPAGDGFVTTLADAAEKLAALTSMASTKNAIADWAQKGVDVVIRLGEVIGGIGSAGGGALGAMFDPALFGKFLDVVESMLPTISSVFSGIQGIVKPIMDSIAAAFAENGPKFAALFEALQPLLAGVGAVIGQVISQALSLLGTIASVITPVVAVLSNVLGPILQRFAPIIASVILLFGGFAGSLVKLIPVVGKFLAPLVQLASWISGKFMPILGFLGKYVGITFKLIGRVIGVVMKGVGKVVSLYWSIVQAVFKAALKGLQKIVPPVFNGIKAVITRVWTGIKTVTTAVWNGIRAYISGVINVIKGIFKGISAVVNFFRNAFERARAAVSEKLQAVIALAKGLPDRVLKGLQNIGSLLLDSGRKLIQGLINGIFDKLGALKDAAGKVAGAVKDFFPFSPVKEGPLKAWNGGKPGQVLMQMLAMGIYKGSGEVVKQAKTVAGGIVQGLATGLASGNLAGIFESIKEKIGGMLDNKQISEKTAKNMTRMVTKVGQGLKKLIKDYEKATTELARLREEHASMVSSIASSLTGELSLGEAKTPDIEAAEAVMDDNGNVVTPAVEAKKGEFTFETVAAHVRTLAARIGAFATKLRKLIEAGIPKELVAEVAALGSETGSQVADALLSGTSAEVGQLVTDWNALQANATKAGQVMADAYYATGIAAQEGLIAGLLDDKALDKAAETLANKLTNKLKKALKISSPSKLMRGKIGKPMGQGVGLGTLDGMDSMQRAVDRRASALINPGNGGFVPPNLRGSQSKVGIKEQMRLHPDDLNRMAAALTAAQANKIDVHLPTGDPEAAAQAVMNRLASRGRW